MHEFLEVMITARNIHFMPFEADIHVSVFVRSAYEYR